MSLTNSLSIVIPALNEESGIQRVVERVLAMRSDLHDAGFHEFELIVVDDGSTDRTAAIVSAVEGVRLLRHPRNRGYGAALKTGFAAAVGEWVGFLDADGTYPPESFPALCRAGIDQQADLVIGSRMAGAQSEMPPVRRLGNRLFATLVSVISGRHITDSASGMRIFRRELLPRLYPLPDGLNLTPVMSTRALHESMNMVEVPIPYAERVGRSKLSVVRDGWRFAQSIVWAALSYNPVRLLGLTGLVFIAIAALVSATLVGARLLGTTSISDLGAYVLFLGMVLGVAGISILTLGISFNYFVALFHTVPVRQGIFGRPIFPRLEQHFGWFGLLMLLAGILVSLFAFGLTLVGIPFERLWIYMLGSSAMVLVGLQLMIAWVQMQVLEALSARERLVQQDLGTAMGDYPHD